MLTDLRVIIEQGPGGYVVCLKRTDKQKILDRLNTHRVALIFAKGWGEFLECPVYDQGKLVQE